MGDGIQHSRSLQTRAGWQVFHRISPIGLRAASMKHSPKHSDPVSSLHQDVYWSSWIGRPLKLSLQAGSQEMLAISDSPFWTLTHTWDGTFYSSERLKALGFPQHSTTLILPPC